MTQSSERDSDRSAVSEGVSTTLFDLGVARSNAAEKRQAIYRAESARRAMRVSLGILAIFWALIAALNVIQPPGTPLIWINVGVAIASVGFIAYAVYYLLRKTRRISQLRSEVAELREAEQGARYRIYETSPQRLLWMYHSDTLSKIEEYRNEALRYRKIHNRFQTVIIIGSLMVTGVTTAAASYRQVEWVGVVVSFFVGVAAGMTGYFKFRERSMNLQRAADDLDRECKAVELGIFVYRQVDKDNRFVEFAERAERIKEDQRNREQQLEQPPDSRTNTAQTTGNA